jgi:hypothetical protein
MKSLAVSILCVLALTGQDAAGAPAYAAPQAPLRHLEFNFSVDYQQNGEGSFGAVGGAGSGVQTGIGSAGRQGTLSVDILTAADDGGLVVRSTEWIEHQPRSSEPVICAVYPDGHVVCPTYGGVSDSQNQLLTYLGRGFFDPALLDSSGKWTRSFSNKDVTVASTFRLAGSADAVPIVIEQSTHIVSANGAFTNWDETATIKYDKALEVPVSVHDVAQQQKRGNVWVQSTMDFRLTKDSYAKPASPSH